MSLNHSPAIVTDGLVLCLDAGNSRSYPKSGTTWSDLVSTNSGSIKNSLESGFSEDNLGEFTFDGANDYIDIAEQIQFDRTDPFTFSAWVFNTKSATGISGYANILNNEDGGYKGYQFGFYDQKLQLYHRNTPTYNFIAVACSNAFTFNEWKHCVATYDGSSSANGVKLYIDGVRQATTTIGNNLTASTVSIHTTYIGTRRPATVTYFGGSIGNISIYNRALSADEVRRNYEATVGRYT